MKLMIKVRGCPMSVVVVRRIHRCYECTKRVLKGEKMYRSLLNGRKGGLERCDLVCIDCGDKFPGIEEVK